MPKIIDTHVYLSRWPFRRLPGDEPQQLVAKLQKSGVRQAWAGSFDALLHRDIAGINLRLTEDCRRHGQGILIPVGTVNPTLPDWEDDLRRCQQVHHMTAIRLHPNYHGYKLEDAAALFKAAAERNFTVQLVMLMEDERTQHPLVRVAPVSLAPLPALIRATPGIHVQLLNHYRMAPPLLKELAELGNVQFDFAMVESVTGLKRIIEAVGIRKMIFGSYYPYFVFEAAALKVKEAGPVAQPLLGDAG